MESCLVEGVQFQRTKLTLLAKCYEKFDSFDTFLK